MSWDGETNIGTEKLCTGNSFDPYDSLPLCIKQYLSRHEYLWLSEEQKRKIIEDNTEPDGEE